MKKMNVGLVLSGGGARGIVHLGVLAAIEEMSVVPSVISGTSAGALIGALYAAGYSPAKILELVKKEASFSLSRLMESPTGIFSAARLRRILQENIPGDSFESLRIPLFVTATDISTGVSVHFSHGRLYEAVIGSAAVPVMFHPVCFDNYCLVDGGVLNNLPAACIREHCDLLIGVHVNKIYNGSPERALDKLSVLEHAFHLAIASNVAISAALCDIVIEPLLAGYSMFDLRKADLLFKVGYEAAMHQLKEVPDLNTHR